MGAANQLMTVAEFLRLPEEQGEVYRELRNGEVVAVTRPKFKHLRVQKRLERLIEQAVGERSVVVMKMPFRARLEYELRVADVACVGVSRWRAIDDDDHLQGAPELVIEVLSPSNTVSELLEKEKLCLENGAEEFWVVDPVRRTVRISTSDGRWIMYGAGQHIPLSIFGAGASIPVDENFS